MKLDIGSWFQKIHCDTKFCGECVTNRYACKKRNVPNILESKLPSKSSFKTKMYFQAFTLSIYEFLPLMHTIVMSWFTVI